MARFRSICTCIALIIFLACEEEDNRLDFSACSENILNESSLILQSIPGDWELVNVTCGLCAEPPSLNDFGTPLVASFSENGSFTINSGGSVVQAGSWDINESSRVVVSVESFEPGNEFSYFPVPALICGDEIISDSSPSDGLGFFYSRVGS